MIYSCYLNDDECTTYSYAYSACELIKCLYNTSSDVLWWRINHCIVLATRCMQRNVAKGTFL